MHLIVDRRTEVSGFLEGETPDDISILWKGETLNFPKLRVLRIVRLVEPRPGQTGTVFRRDGSELHGVVLQDGFEEVIVEIAGIPTRLPRRDVDHVELNRDFEDQYREFQEHTAPDDWSRRMDLARWLFAQRKYALAHQELLPIVDAGEVDGAVDLLRLVEAQLKLASAVATGGPPRGADGGDGASRGSASGRGKPRRSGPVGLNDMLPDRLLTHDDVNIIRVFEMDLRDPPRLAVDAETIRLLLESYGSSDLIPADSAQRTALFRADSAEVVSLMFKLKARDLYPQIRVLSEPTHLNLFRQRVHNAWLIPNCATSRCHGGLDAGRFFLHGPNYKDERVRYTNLLILDQTSIDGKPLIDHDDPLGSLIVQHALPRNQARFPHPDVKGWRPVFTEANQRLLDDTLAWIKSMYLPRPKYPIDFEVPKLDAPDSGAIPAIDGPQER